MAAGVADAMAFAGVAVAAGVADVIALAGEAVAAGVATAFSAFVCRLPFWPFFPTGVAFVVAPVSLAVLEVVEGVDFGVASIFFTFDSARLFTGPPCGGAVAVAFN